MIKAAKYEQENEGVRIESENIHIDMSKWMKENDIYFHLTRVDILYSESRVTTPYFLRVSCTLLVLIYKKNK